MVGILINVVIPGMSSFENTSASNPSSKHDRLVRDGISIVGGNEPVNRTLAFGETFAFNVSLGTTNLNAIKAKYPLCSTSSYTRLAVSVPIVEDYAGNLMTLSFRSIYSGIAPVIYTADTTRLGQENLK